MYAQLIGGLSGSIAFAQDVTIDFDAMSVGTRMVIQYFHGSQSMLTTEYRGIEGGFNLIRIEEP